MKLLKTFEIPLDIEKELYSPAQILFSVSRNDFESIELQFLISQDGAPVDLTGTTVELAIKKPSGLVVYQSVEIREAIEGKAAARLSIQAYVEFGIHIAEIYVRTNESLAVTSPFYFTSRETIMMQEVESVNDWSALQEALFAMDKKPILVEGIPTEAPEYVGQMAFDITGKRAFIANDVIVEGWQLLAAGEGGGGGIIYWNDIIGKPAAFPAESHIHAIADVTGLQAALDGKADDADLLGFQEALDGKADDADLTPFITETEADLKYALKGETGGTLEPHTHIIAEIENLQVELDGKADINHTHVIADITGLQPALDAKADDADLTTKADVNHTHNFTDIANRPLAYPAEAHTHLWADITDKPATFPPPDEFLTQTEADARYALRDAEGGTIQAVDWGTITGVLANQTDLQAALDGKADDADLTGKADVNHTHAIADVTGLQGALDGKADDADLTTKADINHNHAITDVTGLQAALDGKADDADLTGKADVNHTHTFAAITEKPAAYPAEPHNHAIADVTGLQAALDGKADDADLTGKADVVHTHAIGDVTGLQAALDGKADDADLTGKADVNHTHTFAAITDKPLTFPPDVHTHAIADVTGLQAALDGKADDADLPNMDLYQSRPIVSTAIPTLPTVAPAHIGQMAIDTDDSRYFISYGATAANWNELATVATIDNRMNGLSLWKGTQAEYDAITTKDANTLYFITG